MAVETSDARRAFASLLAALITSDEELAVIRHSPRGSRNGRATDRVAEIIMAALEALPEVREHENHSQN